MVLGATFKFKLLKLLKAKTGLPSKHSVDAEEHRNIRVYHKSSMIVLLVAKGSFIDNARTQYDSCGKPARPAIYKLIVRNNHKSMTLISSRENNASIFGYASCLQNPQTAQVQIELCSIFMQKAPLLPSCSATKFCY